MTKTVCFALFCCPCHTACLSPPRHNIHMLFMPSFAFSFGSCMSAKFKNIYIYRLVFLLFIHRYLCHAMPNIDDINVFTLLIYILYRIFSSHSPPPLDGFHFHILHATFAAAAAIFAGFSFCRILFLNGKTLLPCLFFFCIIFCCLRLFLFIAR